MKVLIRVSSTLVLALGTMKGWNSAWAAVNLFVGHFEPTAKMKSFASLKVERFAYLLRGLLITSDQFANLCPSMS